MLRKWYLFIMVFVYYMYQAVCSGQPTQLVSSKCHPQKMSDISSDCKEKIGWKPLQFQ